MNKFYEGQLVIYVSSYDANGKVDECRIGRIKSMNCECACVWCSTGLFTTVINYDDLIPIENEYVIFENKLGERNIWKK